MKQLKTILLSVMIAAAMTATAENSTATRERIRQDPALASGVYRLYPTEFAAQTPAPKGYEPFYISHYGRHGSRYILRNYKFETVLAVFEQARQQGALTPHGADVYARLLRAREICDRRAGDLSPLGREQHRGIADRMWRNWPSVWHRHPEVTACATTIPRVIVSMGEFAGELWRHDPKLNIVMETGPRFMRFLNPYHYDNDYALGKHIDKYRHPVGDWVPAWERFRDGIVDNRRVLASLFDERFAAEGIEDSYTFVFNLFKNVTCMPNTPVKEDFTDIFTNDELYCWWRLINAIFYFEKGPSGVGGGFLNRVTDTLLKDFVDDADAKIAEGKAAVTLRFGHDGVLMGLFNTMQLPGWSFRAPDIESIEETWHDFDIPMASNLQWIFFRHKRTGEVLVKMLINEEEALFPDAIPSDIKPYYRWKDVRDFYKGHLAGSYYEFGSAWGTGAWQRGEQPQRPRN